LAHSRAVFGPHQRDYDMTTYPDTRDGAQAVLRDNLTRTDFFDASAATYQPDPGVRGCWLATFPDGTRFVNHDAHARRFQKTAF
jgi:hypothetical protein